MANAALIPAAHPPASPETVEQCLNNYCNVLLDDAIGVTWDLYRADQKDKLELKVRLALFAESVQVNEETGEYTIIHELPQIQRAITTGHTKAVQWAREDYQSRHILVRHVTDKIWDQRKHTGGDCLRMSIVYIGLVKETSVDPLREVDYMIRPLFRTMKCLDPNTRSAEGKCMVFVDEFGWVFQNWRCFQENTLYPATVIVCPVRGVFARNDNGHVLLTHFKAPRTASEIEKEKWQNIGLTVGGLGSAFVLGATLFMPVAAPVVLGAMGVGAAVGAVSGVKSGWSLFNRSKHEQDISLGDKEARAHWLGLSGMLVGFAASGFGAMLRSAAVAGNVSRGLIYSANTLFGASIFVNGVCVGNSIWELKNSREVTTGDILQLSVSLFLFSHSVYNFQTARTVVTETQTQHLTDYKQTLSKNGQKRFQRKLNNRIRQHGVDRGTGDTIRNLNTAEHYNNNFVGTRGYQTTASQVENDRLRENLANSFVRFELGAGSVGALVQIYSVIVRTTNEEVFELLKKMAEMIFYRYFSDSGSMSIEDILWECYRILQRFAEQKEIAVADVLISFSGESFEAIPRVVREYFRVFIPTIGPSVCPECKGMKFEV